VKQVRVIISGRVQGVWFRGWTLEQARHHGVDGWVRNRRDGSVEAVIAGEDARVDEMLEACRHGPPMARVTDVRCFEHDASVERGFHPKPSV
jgi:acylphosphatase